MKKWFKCFITSAFIVMMGATVYANDYHVKTQNKIARSAVVAFHIPIPDDTNAAAYSLRSAVSEYVGGADFASEVPWLGGTETANLQNGLLFEEVVTVKFLAAADNAQRQTKIENKFTELASSIVTRLKTILKFWRLNGNVP